MNSVPVWQTSLKCSNPHLKHMEEDLLYHLGLSTKSVNFRKEFGDVKFVCVAGSAYRIKAFAQMLAKEAGLSTDLPNLAADGGRFVLYKVGAVLAADHGMGAPSISILLHEMFKLLHYAHCTDVTFIRLGTSGGIGVEPGTLVITTEALDTAFESFYSLRILGKTVKRPAPLDPNLADELYELAQTLPDNVPVVKGKTVCANDFYEEQARLDGAFCQFTESEKMAYLNQACSMGVRNFEMECTCFAAQCYLAGVRAAIVCVTLVNRLESDQVRLNPKTYARIQQLPGQLVLALLRKHNALSV
ncbi:hypothetical protein T265_11797 [Opisthorchis viverrini]|uniref:Nucleoside phosphorylase domain-containing protein n=1 Tax=Opisthorchis viverrini TaxID=6198 RepID=A0A074YXA3_OPIVI|nr:hypothetical protein T265_11797 [Opisthorchis viverrini]KER19431.1 hypothetical protein T265_11797 [Opisthorchis viverrini]